MSDIYQRQNESGNDAPDLELTPISDAAEKDVCGHNVVDTDDMRELEKEKNRIEAEHDRLIDYIRAHDDWADNVTAYLGGLGTDAAIDLINQFNALPK